MVNSNLHNILNTVSLESQYDAQAKKVLAQKIVLAYIMKNTLEDFKDMDPQEIMPYIEGEPMIGVVPVDPGLTNAKYSEGEEEVVGFNTENTIVNEGSVNFDIVFYVHRKCGLTKVILNIEPQKDEPSKYPGSLTLCLPLDFHNPLHHSPLRLIFLSNFYFSSVLFCTLVV